MKRTRRANGEASVYLGSDGDWHGRITVGLRDDGRPDRRHVRGRNASEVSRKLRDIQKNVHSGTLRKAGERWTLEAWLRHWINHVAIVPVIAEYTHDGYRRDVELHLIPSLGAHRLDKLGPEHLERLYARLLEAGCAPGMVHHVHRTVRRALNVAVRQQKLGKNPASLATVPSVRPIEVEPYDVTEVRRLLDAANRRRNSARWAIALALGLRQGEALALKWDDVDFSAAEIRVRSNRLRPRYAHGCGDTCGKKPGYCPKRRRTNPETKDTKSAAGRRTVPLPDEIASLLREHRSKQEVERETAGQLWQDGGWVFTRPDGRALVPRTDWGEWKTLLREAGVRDGRLHDARHTSATVMLLLGVPERTVMAIMGWSSTAMAARYQHVTDKIRRDVGQRLGGLLWSPDGGSSGLSRRRRRRAESGK